MHRFGGGLNMTGFERLMSAHSEILELRVRRAGTTGRQVMICSPEGEVDGVEHGTRGVFEGVLEDLSGRVLAAVRLDDNGELVYVDPKACVLVDQTGQPLNEDSR